VDLNRFIPKETKETIVSIHQLAAALSHSSYVVQRAA